MTIGAKSTFFKKCFNWEGERRGEVVKICQVKILKILEKFLQFWLEKTNYLSPFGQNKAKIWSSFGNKRASASKLLSNSGKKKKTKENFSPNFGKKQGFGPVLMKKSKLFCNLRFKKKILIKMLFKTCVIPFQKKKKK